MAQNEPKEYTRSDLRFAACAGLFDGEGCIGMYPDSRNGYYIQLRVSMTRLEALDRMSGFFGAGTVKKYGPRPGRMPYWTWQCGAREAVIRILKQLRPHLQLKAHEASLALDFLESENLTPAQQRRIYEAMRRVKVRSRRPPTRTPSE